MARLLHPSYFPATRTAPSCEYWGDSLFPFIETPYSLPLKEGMEAYWRVKKWQVSVNLNYYDIESGVSGVLDVSAPSDGVPAIYEEDLVCVNNRRQALTPSGAAFEQDAIFEVGATGFRWEFFAFEFLQFNWPAGNGSGGVVIKIPITFTMGDTIKTIDASVINQDSVVGAGNVTAIEWWPYEDADGKALYDITTGQPL